MRRNNVASMSFRRYVPTRFLINQCHIITFLIPSTWYICDFFLFHIEIEAKGGWIIGGGGGAKGMLAPTRIIGPPGPPIPTPMYHDKKTAIKS